MLSILMTIWFLHVAAMVSPGPNFLLVSQLAASDRGRSAGFAALGVTLGALLGCGARTGRTCAALSVWCPMRQLFGLGF